MIEAAPSTIKNAISSNVSENAPVKGENGRNKRPLETRRVSQPVCGEETDDAADQEQPAEQDGDSQCCQRWQHDRRRSQNKQHNTFDKKENPVLAQRGP